MGKIFLKKLLMPRPHSGYIGLGRAHRWEFSIASQVILMWNSFWEL